MEKKKIEITDDQLYKTPKDQLGYAEEYIIVKGETSEEDQLLNFSLSNSLEDIEIAIFNRTQYSIDLENAHWKIYPYFSVSIKSLMNRHNVKYSMTTTQYKENLQIKIYMRSDDIWLITGFDELSGTLKCWNQIETLEAIKNAFKEAYKEAFPNDEIPEI